MATFSDQANVQINTTTPDIQVVDNKPSNTFANNAAILGNAAIEGYKTKVRFDAKNSMEGVLDKLNEDLQQAEDEGTVGEMLNESFDNLAKQDPSIRALKSRLGSFKTAEEQKRGVLSLLQLRAEAELKKTIRKAPGMRREITSIASGILGRDPSGALVNTLLSSLNASSDSREKTDRDIYSAKIAGNLAGIGLPAAFDEQGNYDLDTNEKRWISVKEAEKGVDKAKQDRELGKVRDRDVIEAELRALDTRFNILVKDAYNTFGPLQSAIHDTESYGTYKSVVIPALAEFRDSMTLSINSRIASLPANSADREYLESRRESIIENNVAPLERLLKMEDNTVVKQTLDFHKTLMETYNMELSQANTVLSALQQFAPGVIQQIIPMVLSSSPEDAQQLTSSLINSINQIGSPEDIKKVDMAKLIKTLSYDGEFEKLGTDDKIKQAKKLSKFTKDMFEKYDWNEAHPSAYEATSRAVMGSMSVMPYANTASKENYMDLLLDQGMPEFIGNVGKFAVDGTAKSEVLADQTNEFLYTSGKEVIFGNLKDALRNPGDKSVRRIIFDNETGMMSSVSSRDDSVSDSMSNMYRVSGGINNSKILKNVDRFNKTVDTIYNLRESSPTYANMTKPQIATALFSDEMYSIGVEFRGEPVTLPSSEPQEEAVPLSEVMMKAAQELVEKARSFN